jgi:hypothetical protein
MARGQTRSAAHKTRTDRRLPSSNSLIRCVPALRRSPRRGLFSTSDRGPPEPGVPRGRTALAAWHTLRGGEADEHADSCGYPRRPARAAPGGVRRLRGEVAAGDPGPLGEGGRRAGRAADLGGLRCLVPGLGRGRELRPTDPAPRTLGDHRCHHWRGGLDLLQRAGAAWRHSCAVR